MLYLIKGIITISTRIKKKLDDWMGRPNEMNIIRYLMLNSKTSRTDISEALSISMSTVTNVTEELICDVF